MAPPNPQSSMWQPTWQLSMIAWAISGMADEVAVQAGNLREAQGRPHVFDDATVDGVIASYTEQQVDLWPYEEAASSLAGGEAHGHPDGEPRSALGSTRSSWWRHSTGAPVGRSRRVQLQAGQVSDADDAGAAPDRRLSRKPRTDPPRPAALAPLLPHAALGGSKALASLIQLGWFTAHTPAANVVEMRN
jgi:hypothetical protein